MTQPSHKKQKKPKKLILSAATLGTATYWKDPKDESRNFSNSIDAWIKLAKVANKGKLHSIFFVDHLSWFDVYGGNHRKAASIGVNAARIDPAAVVAALARETEDIGFNITLSTVSEHPYHFSRRLASLDHLTGGRVGWNVVASYLPSIGENLLNGAPLTEHDERYERAEEYLDIVYDLLLGSWRDDAVVFDREKGVFADPDRIREIDHKGKYFNVRGPAISEPTKQRIPLISQAGGSERGKLLGAENGELIYVSLYDYEQTANVIKDIRQKASENFGRDPSSIKFIVPVTVFVGETHEEAVERRKEFLSYQDLERPLVYFGGTSGVDVADLDWDEPIPAKSTNGIKGSVERITEKDGKTFTKNKLVEKYFSDRVFIGTAKEVADELQEVVEKTDIDGYNFHITSFPTALEEIVRLLVPELQKRGLAQTEYAVPGGTFRENFYGVKDQPYLAEKHPASNIIWKPGESQQEYEARLGKYKKLRDQRRADAKENIASD